MCIMWNKVFCNVKDKNSLFVSNWRLYNVELKEHFCSWESTSCSWHWTQFGSDDFKSLTQIQNEMHFSCDLREIKEKEMTLAPRNGQETVLNKEGNRNKNTKSSMQLQCTLLFVKTCFGEWKGCVYSIAIVLPFKQILFIKHRHTKKKKRKFSQEFEQMYPNTETS